MEISDSNLKSYKSWQIPKSWHVGNKYHLKPTNITRLFRMTEIELPWLNSDKNNVNILAVDTTFIMLSVWGRCTNWWNIGQPTFLWRWGQEVAGAGAAPQPPLSGATQPGMTMTMTMTSCSFCSSSVGIRKLKEMYWWGLWGRKHQESFPLHTKDTFQIETQKPLGQEVSVDICQYLLYHLRMYFLYPASVSAYYCVPRVH